MEILVSLNGIPISVPNSQLAEWIEQTYAGLPGTSIENSPEHFPDSWRFCLPRRTNYTPKIGELFWPIDASRFGWFRTVCTESQYAAMVAVDAINTYLTVTVSDNAGGFQGHWITYGYLLPPVPITGPTDAKLLLIQWVDQRFYDRSKLATLSDATGAASGLWDAAADAVYLYPERDSPLHGWTGKGFLRDAVGANTGRFWDPGYTTNNLDGSPLASASAGWVKWKTVIDNWGTRVPNAAFLLSGSSPVGSQSRMVVPANFTMIARRYAPNEIINYRDTSFMDQLRSTYGLGEVSITEKFTVALSSLPAGYSALLGNETRTSFSAMRLDTGAAIPAGVTPLVTQLFKDVIDYELCGMSAVYAGFYPPGPALGSDILYTLHNGKCTTRYIKQPHDGMPRLWLHGTNALAITEDTLKVRRQDGSQEATGIIFEVGPTDAYEVSQPASSVVRVVSQFADHNTPGIIGSGDPQRMVTGEKTADGFRAPTFKILDQASYVSGVSGGENVRAYLVYNDPDLKLWVWDNSELEARKVVTFSAYPNKHRVTLHADTEGIPSYTDDAFAIHDGTTEHVGIWAGNGSDSLLDSAGGLLTALRGVGGDIPYFTASQWQRLAIGATGKYLRSTGTIPEWADVPTPSTVSDGDKGDITVASGLWTIDEDVVTNSKLAEMSYQRIKARKTTGTGNPEDCTISEVLDFLGTTKGDIAVRDTSTWSALAGNTTTTRKFLRQTGTGSASAVPAWDTLTTSDLPSGDWITNTYGTALLSSDYTCTTSYASTGLTLSIPSAGKYLVWMNCYGQAYHGSGIAETGTRARLTENSSGSYTFISDSEGLVAQVHPVQGTVVHDSCTQMVVKEFSAACTMRLEAIYFTGGSSPSCKITASGGGYGYTLIGYMKIG